MTVYTGAIHLHTTLSHDGVLTLEQLVAFLRARGFDFIAVTEHSQDLTSASLSGLADACRARSSSEFLVIPGVEFTCTGTIHILGLGVTHLCDSDDPSIVVDHIHAHGGVAILAHPSHKEYDLDPSWLVNLDGCEIWNNRNGKWLPQLKAVRKFQELADIAPGLKAFSGLDLHEPEGYSHVATWVESEALCPDAVFGAMRRATYTTGGRFLRITPAGDLDFLAMSYLKLSRGLLNFVRSTRNRLVAAD